MDEADFVKNVGKYVYILANGHLRIVEAWHAGLKKNGNNAEGLRALAWVVQQLRDRRYNGE